MLQLRLQNSEHIMINYFHYKGIVNHNSIFIIVSKTMHLAVALYPIEANQVFMQY